MAKHPSLSVTYRITLTPVAVAVDGATQTTGGPGPASSPEEQRAESPEPPPPTRLHREINEQRGALVYLPRDREERSDLITHIGGERWLILGFPGEEETLIQCGYIYRLGDEAMEGIGPSANLWHAEFGFELPGLGGLILAAQTFDEILDLVALHVGKYGVKVLDREGSPYMPSWWRAPERALGMTVVSDHLRGWKVERLIQRVGEPRRFDLVKPGDGRQVLVNVEDVELVRDPTFSPWSA